MAKFCGKCGSKLDEVIGKCPQCGRNYSENGYGRGKKLVCFLISVILVGAAFGVTFLLYSERQLESEPFISVEQPAESGQEKTTESISLKPEQTESSVSQTGETADNNQLSTSDADTSLPSFVDAYMQIIRETEEKSLLNCAPAGKLQDMNGDDIPELTFIYDILVPETVTYYDGTTGEEELPYSVCDLYTYDHGKVIQLMDQEIMFSAMGVENSFCAFVEIEGQQYFALEGYGGPTGVGYSDKCRGLDADSLGDYTEGYIKLYTLDGSKLKCKTDVIYRYHSYAKNSNFSGTMNGASITENEYRTWCSNLPPIDWFNQWCGISLVDLQTQLKENSWTQAQSSDPIWVEYPVESVKASSVYEGDNRNHSAFNLLDGDPQTNWTEGAEGNGLGEWILFTFKDRYRLDSISICGGCRTDEKRYYDNARPKKVTLTFSDGSSFAYTLNDNEFLSEQYIHFDTPIITESVKITIDSVYPGEKYEDTVISDVFFGAYTVE